MISDILSDAAAEIARARSAFPVYSHVEADIDEVLAAMERLRAKLDTPPSSFQL